MPTPVSIYGGLEPVQLLPNAGGVGADRLTNSKNLSLALADFLDDAYVEPGIARPSSTYED